MNLNNLTLGIIIVVLLCGGIAASVLLDVWDTKPTAPALVTTPEATNSSLSENGDNNNDIQAPIDFNTPYKPAEIRGTNTFAEISAMFRVPLDDLGNGFGLMAIPNYSSLRARELKSIYTNLGPNIKLETESVRVFVSMYTGKPYNFSHTAYLPLPAVQILKQKATISAEQLAYLDTHALEISTMQGSKGTGAVPSNRFTVTGETSFQRLIDIGISSQDIEKAIGDTLPSTNVLIRDYAIQKNKDFLAMISALQELVNKRYPPR